MLSWQIKETSKKSPARALDRALKEAKKTVKGSPRSDIFLADIQDSDDGWRAILNVIAEPGRKKQKLPAPDISAFMAEEEEEKEKKKSHDREEAYKHQQEDYGHELLDRVAQRAELAMFTDEEVINLYAELFFEHEVLDVAPKYDFTSIHFVSKGSLWDKAQQLHPDLEFYEAAHDGQSEHNIFEWIFNVESRKPRPGRRSVLSPELTDE